MRWRKNTAIAKAAERPTTTEAMSAVEDADFGAEVGLDVGWAVGAKDVGRGEGLFVGNWVGLFEGL